MNVAISQEQQTATRRVGRPDHQASEELVRHILDIATRLFIEQGYPATSIEQIAAAAGAGKQTIYRHFESKERLFLEVLDRQAQQLLEIARSAESPSANPIEALRDSCRRLFDFILRPEVIRLHRVLVAEVGRFPEAGTFVLENCTRPFDALFHRLLTAAEAEGQVRIGDPNLVQALLEGLLTGWPLLRYLHGQEPFESAAARDAYFEAAWTLFLNGVRKESER